MAKTPHVAVIGAGASGMMAAISAARRGARVTILERQERVGKKILATGNGRCNLTNSSCTVKNYHSSDPDFVGPVLAQFPVAAALEFFHQLGVCTLDEHGRVYPLTGQASTVLDVLRLELASLEVEQKLRAEVQEIIPDKGVFVLNCSPGQVQVDRVVVASGGRAAPQLGGDDSGIHLLEQLGHTVLPTFPALVPLKTGLRFNRQLKGVKVMGSVKLEIAGKIAAIEQGEILFTAYGLSGPPVIQLSLAANLAQIERRPVALILDLFSSWQPEQIKEELQTRFSARPQAKLADVLIGLVHKRLIPVLMSEAGITDLQQPVGQTSAVAAECLLRVLKEWRVVVTGSLSWKEAQIMAGGISTVDFSSATLASKRCRGLFAAGEVLDVTGDCGGFNLQWAWSSGWVAGIHAALP